MCFCGIVASCLKNATYNATNATLSVGGSEFTPKEQPTTQVDLAEPGDNLGGPGTFIRPFILLPTHACHARARVLSSEPSLLQRPQNLKAGDVENSSIPAVYLELAGCVELGKVVWGPGTLCDSPHFLQALSWLRSAPLMTFPQAQPKITNTF